MRDLTLSSQAAFFLYDMAVLHTKSVLGNQFAHPGPIIAFLVLIDEMGLSVGLQVKIHILALWAQSSVRLDNDGSHQEPGQESLLAKVKHFPSLQRSWPVSKKDLGVFFNHQLSL